MLITNPTVRATLAEVTSHPWVVLGFNGPPDPHVLQREPLRADELDRQVIRGMTGFEFGSEQVIEKKLVAILESEEYIRAAQHWKKKHKMDGHASVHGKEVWDLFSPPPYGISHTLPLTGNTSSKTDPPTSSKKTKRFVRPDLNPRKLFSKPKKPVSPMAHSPSNSENHLSHPALDEPEHEPPDPTSGYHPLLSIYYLAREKLERERIYGPGQFASSQLSIQDPSGTASAASSSEGLTEGRSSRVNIHIDNSFPEREKEPPTPVSAGSKADYYMPLPRLLAPDTLLHSRTSYRSANASSSEELPRNEEAKWKKREVRRKEQEAKWKEQEAKEKEELRKKDEEVRKRELEVRKQEEEVKKREEEVKKREEGVRKNEEEMRRRAEEAQQTELEARQKNDADMVCARLFTILQVPESHKKLVCLQEHQAQEMMDLLQKVRLAFWTNVIFIRHAYMIIWTSC